MNLNALLKFSTIQRYNVGATIFTQGEALREEMLILLQGQAGVYKDYGQPGQKEVELIGPGDFIGERGLFLARQPLHTVVATEPAIAVAINRSNVNELFTTLPEITFTIISQLCIKLEALRNEHDALIEDVRAGVATKKMQEAEAKASRSSNIFPEGHGSYTLPIDNTLSEFLYEDTVTCPLCAHVFKNLMLITSKLRRDGDAERDMRVRYKGIEPMFHELVSCPGCLYTADKDAFLETSKRVREQVNDEIGRFKSEMHIKVGYERDSFTVFAGYYLAILCAPFAHEKYQLEQALLWQKLGRIYTDMEDEPMAKYAAEKALERYRYSYGNIRVGPAREQQLCYIIGDLLERTGDEDEAMQFFFSAKANRSGTPVLKRQADLRLEEIRERKRAAKGE